MTGVFDDDVNDDPRPGRGLLGGGLPQVFQEASVVVKAPVGTTLDTIPAPRPPESDGELTPQEREAFEACKAGMNNLQTAFWVAGKSLETMRVGNLHRNENVPNFADYVMATWEVSETQAYRLMDEWRIGEALSELGWKPREAQIRELTDIKREAGDQAAVAVYDAVARTGRRVTAKLLGEVARGLPPLSGETSPAEIGQLVRKVLAPPPPPESQDRQSSQNVSAQSTAGDVIIPPVADITSIGKDSPIGESGAQPSDSKGSDAGSADVQRLTEVLAVLREVDRGVSKPAVKRALEQDPETAAALVADISKTLNKIERTMSVRGAN
ncbi:hypothetical protein ACWD4T_00610 [Streptomyces umbrinus]